MTILNTTVLEKVTVTLQMGAKNGQAEHLHLTNKMTHLDEVSLLQITYYVYVSTHKLKITIQVQASPYRYETAYSYGELFMIQYAYNPKHLIVDTYITKKLIVVI